MQANRNVSIASPGLHPRHHRRERRGQVDADEHPYGFYEADSGAIEVDGKPVRIRNREGRDQAGIGMVHQHFMLVDTFSVLENVMLGAESGALLKRSRDLARAELQRLARDYGLNVDPDATTGELPVGNSSGSKS